MSKSLINKVAILTEIPVDVVKEVLETTRQEALLTYMQTGGPIEDPCFGEFEVGEGTFVDFIMSADFKKELRMIKEDPQKYIKTKIRKRTKGEQDE